MHRHVEWQFFFCDGAKFKSLSMRRSDCHGDPVSQGLREQSQGVLVVRLATGVEEWNLEEEKEEEDQGSYGDLERGAGR